VRYNSEGPGVKKTLFVIFEEIWVVVSGICSGNKDQVVNIRY
jgi:hypothetical protein